MSVIVCCHNSAGRIRITLEHLKTQVCGVPWEVVLVDNASSDDTVATALEAWQATPRPAELRVVDEPNLGLACARKAGVMAARYEYVLFCDDDNWLDQDYIQTAFNVMRGNSDIGVLGGQNLPMSDREVPHWFWSHARGYAAGVQALETGDITHRGLVWGAGMVLRRSVYVRVCAADMPCLLSDRKGRRLSTGGDNEISMWFVLAGYRLWYDESLRLRHYIPSERLTKQYCRQLRTGSDEAGMILRRYSMVAKSLETTEVFGRIVQFGAGLARMAAGNPVGRFAAQAFNPLPIPVFDRMTKDICQVATRVRSDPPPGRGAL